MNTKKKENKLCGAVSSSTGEQCKLNNIWGSKYCKHHIEKSNLIYGGLIGALLGYGLNWILPTPELNELRDFRNTMKPIIEFVEEKYPNQNLNSAIDSLTIEFNSLDSIVSTNYFKPLSDQLKKSISELVKANLELTSIHLKITFEPGIHPELRKFLNQFYEIQKQNGLKVKPPEPATRYLVGEVYPVTLLYNKKYENLTDEYWKIVDKFILPNELNRANPILKEKEIRVHFAGKPTFKSNGKILLE